MKKILFLILIFSSQLVLSKAETKIESVEIGPLEKQDDVLDICKYECAKKKAEWNNKWSCVYSPEIKQHNCVCECVKK